MASLSASRELWPQRFFIDMFFIAYQIAGEYEYWNVFEKYIKIHATASYCTGSACVRRVVRFV